MKIGKRTSEQFLEEATYTLRLENGIKIILGRGLGRSPKAGQTHDEFGSEK